MRRRDITDQIVCQAYLEWKKDGTEFVDAILMRWFPEAPPKVIYAAMMRADNHGLISCGVSLRTGWLTDKGIEVASHK